MRVLWSRFTLYALDSLLRFVDAAALNTLATTIPEAALADTLSTRNLWKITGERLQATSTHWFLPSRCGRSLPKERGWRGGVADEVNRTERSRRSRAVSIRCSGVPACAPPTGR